MNEDITRVVTITPDIANDDVTISDLSTDNGYTSKFLEKGWHENEPDLSSIPRPARYPVRYQWSNKHSRDLYHILDVPNRDVIEIHSANVQAQLLGCGAPGEAVAEFKANSIHPGMPPVDCQGVTSSVDAIAAFHEAMKDPVTQVQDPFWIEYL